MDSNLTSDAAAPRPDTRQTLQFLDGLRGLAALYVVLYHARIVLWEGYGAYLSHVQLYSLPNQILANLSHLFDYGHQAVEIFFILSGFVIHLRYARQAQIDPASTFDMGPFLIRRVRRIYPPLLWALFLTLILDRFGVLTMPAVQLAMAQFGQNVTYYNFNARMIGQLTLFPSALTWGSNIPLWSLRIEWWYYLIYPILWALNRRSLRLSTGIVIGLWLVSLIPGVWPLINVQDFFSMFVLWWMGALLAEIYVGRIKIPFSRLAPLAIGIAVMPFILNWPLLADPPTGELLWGLSLLGGFAALFAWQQRGGKLMWLERLKPLGDMSYTLYITHLPILILISALIIARSPTLSEPANDFAPLIIGVIICVLSAYVTHLVVERPFQRQSLQDQHDQFQPAMANEQIAPPL